MNINYKKKYLKYKKKYLNLNNLYGGSSIDAIIQKIQLVLNANTDILFQINIDQSTVNNTDLKLKFSFIFKEPIDDNYIVITFNHIIKKNVLQNILKNIELIIANYNKTMILNKIFKYDYILKYIPRSGITIYIYYSAVNNKTSNRCIKTFFTNNEERLNNSTNLIITYDLLDNPLVQNYIIIPDDNYEVFDTIKRYIVTIQKQIVTRTKILKDAGSSNDNSSDTNLCTAQMCRSIKSSDIDTNEEKNIMSISLYSILEMSFVNIHDININLTLCPKILEKKNSSED